jgi:hypothetical protein
MSNDPDVGGAMTKGGLSVLTTGTGYAKSEVDTKFSQMITSAPEALNTLSELASALGNDSNYASNISNQILAKADKAKTNIKSNVDALLLQQEPRFITTGPIFNHLNVETGNVELILDLDFIATVEAKATLTYVNTELVQKADQLTTYSKTQVNDMVNAIDLYDFVAPVAQYKTIGAGDTWQIGMDNSYYNTLSALQIYKAVITYVDNKARTYTEGYSETEGQIILKGIGGNYTYFSQQEWGHPLSRPGQQEQN